MISHVLVELQDSLDIETNIEKRADLEKKIKSLRGKKAIRIKKYMMMMIIDWFFVTFY